MNRFSPRWLLFALILAMVGAWWVWASRVPADQITERQTPAPALHHPAPAFEVQTVAGDAFSTAAQAGKPMVINFWATWCGPCRNEMPALEDASKRYADRVSFIGVNQGEDAPTIEAFADELGLTLPLGIDQKQAVGADLYNVSGLPTTFFVDGSGVIRRVWMGEMNSITLEEGLAEILGS